MTRCHTHQSAERSCGPAVSIEVWPGGFYPLPDPETDRPDCHLIYSVGEAAALADLLANAVAGVVGDEAVTTPSRAEAIARLDDARGLLEKFMTAKRIRLDNARRHSDDDQVHAIVPMDLVVKLASVLAPGRFPFFDPYADEEVEP